MGFAFGSVGLHKGSLLTFKGGRSVFKMFDLQDCVSMTL